MHRLIAIAGAGAGAAAALGSVVLAGRRRGAPPHCWCAYTCMRLQKRTRKQRRDRHYGFRVEQLPSRCPPGSLVPHFSVALRLQVPSVEAFMQQYHMQCPMAWNRLVKVGGAHSARGRWLAVGGLGRGRAATQQLACKPWCRSNTVRTACFTPVCSGQARQPLGMPEIPLARDASAPAACGMRRHRRALYCPCLPTAVPPYLA